VSIHSNIPSHSSKDGHGASRCLVAVSPSLARCTFWGPGDKFVMLGNNLCKCALIEPHSESICAVYDRRRLGTGHGPDDSGRISQESSSLVTDRQPLEKLFWNTIRGCSTPPLTQPNDTFRMNGFLPISSSSDPPCFFTPSTLRYLHL